MYANSAILDLGVCDRGRNENQNYNLNEEQEWHQLICTYMVFFSLFRSWFCLVWFVTLHTFESKSISCSFLAKNKKYKLQYEQICTIERRLFDLMKSTEMVKKTI